LDSILIFGGGELQLSLIKTVKNMGFSTIVIDPDVNAPGKDISDLFFVVDAEDYQSTLDIAKHYKVKGIVTTATDHPIIMMAKIASKLNLRFPSVESVSTILDKVTFKNVLQNNNILCAKGYSYYISERPIELDLNYPIIIKPNRNSGSRGVFKCYSYEELLNFLPDTIKFCSDGKYLIEEYIEGDEISVEGYIYQGKLQIVQVTDKIVSNPPYNVEMGHIQPSKYRDSIEDIYYLLNRVVSATGLDNCGIHPELKVNDSGFYLIEMGPRLGGDYITSRLVPLSTGFNIEEAIIKISIGEEPNYEFEDNAAMIKYLDIPDHTIVQKCPTENFVKEISDNVKEFSFNLKCGDVVPHITNSLDRYGYIIISCNTISEMINEVDEINQQISRLIMGNVGKIKQ